MFEVEVKAALRVPATLRRALEAQGALAQGTTQQVDTYYSHPARDLGHSDEALRLREEAGALELTYKGPRQGGGAVKSRAERSVRVAHDPTPLLEALGFHPFATVRKRRESWRWGAVTVCLDEVEGLGRFVEVEVVGPDRDEARHAVEDALVRLGLEGAERYQASYLEMLHAAGTTS